MECRTAPSWGREIVKCSHCISLKVHFKNRKRIHAVGYRVQSGERTDCGCKKGVEIFGVRSGRKIVRFASLSCFIKDVYVGLGSGVPTERVIDSLVDELFAVSDIGCIGE